MKALANQSTLIFVSLVIITLLYLLAPILTPFLLGALLAYLVDPLVKRLEAWHVPHLLSVVLIFLSLFLGVILLISLALPLIVKQLEILAAQIPHLLDWAQNVGMPWLLQFVNINTLKTSIPATLSKTGWVISTFVESGFAAIQSIISIVLTPVVTFYLLRDWNKVIAGIKSLLPKQVAPTIIQLSRDCDEVLGAFIRGQLLVMLCLGVIYGVGLSLAGLKLGLMIGLIGGLLSIVPYLGSLFVVIAAIIAAIVQTGTKEAVISVIIVFIIGQLIEGYILTPYLVGGRIGLHPVAVIFSIMAGGALFGFFGILLALPVAAVLMAMFRFFRKRMAS
ncbi:hypothetical protein AQUSIP_10510 [Aquicella siphonis]|uniref:AI-2 transport protein TqsA n=1 Tax=Aquicella siphonis TaxID=254247 RepID=A0A5E4PH20_9COXI|nr:AI-2E family transporter [Aquicella siphonis]VVC75757.1 hypothetical protein AQUSIP_10510 [Aquicella siphonis]